MQKSSADPWVRLAAAMASQAIKDLHSPDVIKALDALGWFLNGEAEIILEAIDALPNGDILQKAVTYEK